MTLQYSRVTAVSNFTGINVCWPVQAVGQDGTGVSFQHGPVLFELPNCGCGQSACPEPSPSGCWALMVLVFALAS